jgi:hypothetical protein
MSRTLSLLLATLFAALVFHAAARDVRLTVIDEVNALVGVGEIDVDRDEVDLDLYLLRGIGGFVDVVAEVRGGDPVRYPAFFGAAGLIIEVDGAWLDVGAFAATFGQGQPLDIDVDFQDRIRGYGDRHDGRSDDRSSRDGDDDWDDDRRDRDDDDRGRDDDRYGRDDDDDWDDDDDDDDWDDDDWDDDDWDDDDWDDDDWDDDDD